MFPFMNNRLCIILIAAIILLNGCGSVREYRIREAVLSDASIPEEIRRAIDYRELMVGMTKEQVIASWGLPCKWCFGTRRSPGGDTWEYVTFGSEYLVTGSDFLGIGNGIYLFFDKDGILKHWSSE